jgi:hypothetical protein
MSDERRKRPLSSYMPERAEKPPMLPFVLGPTRSKAEYVARNRFLMGLNSAASIVVLYAEQSKDPLVQDAALSLMADISALVDEHCKTEREHAVSDPNTGTAGRTA